jgi:Concanavalin A-like lectin/glucanases superfamily
MLRWFLLAAICAGCGSVNDPGPPDAPPPPELLTGTLRDGCVLALHMEEAAWSGVTGEVLDDCGNDNPGTVVGQGTTTVASGVRGRAGNFSGSGCIHIPDDADLHGATGLTFSAWILATKLNHGDGANGVISKRTGGNNQNEYSASVWINDHLWVDLDGEDNRFEGMATITERTWTQLTVVYDGARPAAERARAFINGSLDVTRPETSATLAPYPSVLHVGCMPAPTASPPTQQNFIGEIDEVVIWNRALTEVEIAQWYANTRP